MSSIRSPQDPTASQSLRDALDRALQKAESEGGLRAFAIDGITCVVTWHPAGASGTHEVRLALRRGISRREHVAIVADLAFLQRACEHHVREFARAEGVHRSPALAAPAPSPRLAEAVSPEDRLRATLDLEPTRR